MHDGRLCVLGVAQLQSIHTLRWARRLADRGVEMHLVSDAAPVRPDDLSGIHVHDIRRLDAITRVRGLRRVWIGRAIRALAGRIGADVVHAHATVPYAWWAANAGFHPLVVSPWGRDVLVDAKTEPGRSRTRQAFDAADWLVVNSDAIRAAAVEAGADPDMITHTIWHTNLAGFGPERANRAALLRRFGWPDDAVVVLSLRNFQERTNIDVLVRAFRRARAEEPGARLLLAARAGTHRAAVEALVRELDLGDAVAFHRVEPEALPELAASGDVVVSIASTDSSPSSLLEAMASGQPLIGGWCASIDEWIGDGDGAEMIAPRDEDALVAALLRLIRDPELRRRYGERNERVARERVQESGAQLERLYRRLAAEHRERRAALAAGGRRAAR
jgi:glycosyltransferase involved in cell wall biosynthesis